MLDFAAISMLVVGFLGFAYGAYNRGYSDGYELGVSDAEAAYNKGADHV